MQEIEYLEQNNKSLNTTETPINNDNHNITIDNDTPPSQINEIDTNDTHNNICSTENASIVFVVAVVLVTLVARLTLFEYRSGDYNSFLVNWFDELKSEPNFFKRFGVAIGDYTPPYLYIMSFLTILPLDFLISGKIVSVIFDYLLAFLMANIIYKVTKSQLKSIMALCVTLIAPTIMLNSAMWAQCDVIFVFFLTLCLSKLLDNKPIGAMIAFSISFCFKLQAIFLLPLLGLLFVKKIIKIRHLFIIPVVYLISIIPAFLAGRPFQELISIYFSQGSQYPYMALSAPNLYSWFNNSFGDFLTPFAVIICFVAILIVLYYSFYDKSQIGYRYIIQYAVLFSVLVPFLLPRMHERYFYLADVMTIMYAFTVPKRAWVAVTVSLCSLASYMPFLQQTTPIPFPYLGIAMLVVLYTIVNDIYNYSQVSCNNNYKISPQNPT